nr:hypothetical protein CFP56_67577 [Quercus suber]
MRLLRCASPSKVPRIAFEIRTSSLSKGSENQHESFLTAHIPHSSNSNDNGWSCQRLCESTTAIITIIPGSLAPTPNEGRGSQHSVGGVATSTANFSLYIYSTKPSMP